MFQKPVTKDAYVAISLWAISLAGLFWTHHVATLLAAMVTMLVVDIVDVRVWAFFHWLGSFKSIKERVKLPGVIRGDRIHGFTLLILGAGFVTLLILAAVFMSGAVSQLKDVLKSPNAQAALTQGAQEAIDQVVSLLQRLGLGGLLSGLPFPLDAASLLSEVTGWLKHHALEATGVAGGGAKILMHGLLGALLGVLIRVSSRGPASAWSRFVGSAPETLSPAGRILRVYLFLWASFADFFNRVLSAQVAISLINSLLTLLFLVGMSVAGPSFAIPHIVLLVILCFLFGLLPVLGNLVSNVCILMVALTVSLKAAVLVISFLVIIHKLEYFVNAKIMGSTLGASILELLLAMLIFENLGGVMGVVMAPMIWGAAKVWLLSPVRAWSLPTRDDRVKDVEPVESGKSLSTS